MTSAEIIARNQAHELGIYARFPVAFVRGRGCELWDAEGKRQEAAWWPCTPWIAPEDRDRVLALWQEHVAHVRTLPEARREVAG